MLITLYGPDSYRRLKKLNEIIEIYKEKHSGLSHERFDLSEDDSFFRFKDFIGTRSMFDSTQLAILDNALENSNKKELKEILKKYQEEKDTTIVINLEKKPQTFKFLIEKPVQSQEYPALKDEKLLAFIKKVSDEHGLSLNAETQRAF